MRHQLLYRSNLSTLLLALVTACSGSDTLNVEPEDRQHEVADTEDDVPNGQEDEHEGHEDTNEPPDDVIDDPIVHNDDPVHEEPVEEPVVTRADVTFLISDAATVERFGAGTMGANLLNSLRSETDANKGTLLSFRGQNDTAAFPFTAEAYGGAAMLGASSTWSYVNLDESRSRAIQVDALGAVSLAQEDDFVLTQGETTITISKARMSGTLENAGNIERIRDLRIEGCVAAAQLASLGRASALLARIEQDCASGAGTTLDGYNFSILSQPVVVTVAE